MPKREYPNPMAHRQYLSTTSSTYDRLYGRKVFHIDAWLWQMPDDVLYLVVESRAGGQQVLERTVYRVGQSQGIVPVTDSEPEREGIARHIDSPWARKYAPWLNSLHWATIQPTLRIPRAGFKGHVSVRLHYVWTDPALDDPMRGLENLYAITGRKERDAGQRIHLPSYGTVIDAPAWSAADRSMLRTLQKLLQ